MSFSAFLRRFPIYCPLLTAVSCIPAGDGVKPREDVIYFPVGLALDGQSDYLYVINSDFDLQYNQGTVQSLVLSRLRSLARVPCLQDKECKALEVCDTTPTDANQQEPSFFCVDSPDAEASDSVFPGQPCGRLAENTNIQRATAPGRCGPIDITEVVDVADPFGEAAGPILKDAVETSAFATQGLLVENPDTEGPDRLFLPVRGDSSLTWMEVRHGEISCGQGTQRKLPDKCGPKFQVTTIPEVLARNEDEDDTNVDPNRLPPEPFDIAATPDGRVLAMTHQVGGRASVVLNDFEAPPTLVSVLEGLPANPIGIAAIPQPALVDRAGTESGAQEYQAGFLTTFRNVPQVNLLRFFDDGTFDAARDPDEFDVDLINPFLFNAGNSVITTNSSGQHSRGIIVDDFIRRQAEEACATDDLECLAAAAATPLDIYVANRSPNSLLVGKTDQVDATVAAGDLPTFHDNIPLTAGPSRVVLGQVTNAAGEQERRVFIICFDSQIIYIYDPEQRRVEGQIFTGRGPYTIAFDSQLPIAYIGHFTDSYLSVVSLDQRYSRTYGAMLAMVGTPSPPRASK